MYTYEKREFKDQSEVGSKERRRQTNGWKNATDCFTLPDYTQSVIITQHVESTDHDETLATNICLRRHGMLRPMKTTSVTTRSTALAGDWAAEMVTLISLRDRAGTAISVVTMIV